MDFFVVLILLVVVVASTFLFTRKRMKKEQEVQVMKTRELLHDLKNPLTSVLGYIELLKLKDRSREQQIEFLDIIRSESERLLQILCSYLGNNITEISDDSTKYANCAKVVSLVCRGFAPDAEKKGITISYSCDTELYVDFDETKLWRIVTNLVENAIKYNKPGGSVDVSVSNENNFVILKCIDTGIGIRSENISKVFNNGFRENKSLPGFGFGLSTVRNLVNENGGFIQLESEPGRGTKFTLKLKGIDQVCETKEPVVQESNCQNTNTI